MRAFRIPESVHDDDEDAAAAVEDDDADDNDVEIHAFLFKLSPVCMEKCAQHKGCLE